jgi:hypothetical protein
VLLPCADRPEQLPAVLVYLCLDKRPVSAAASLLDIGASPSVLLPRIGYLRLDAAELLAARGVLETRRAASTVHSRGIHSRDVHSRGVHSRDIHSRAIHSRGCASSHPCDGLPALPAARDVLDLCRNLIHGRGC